MAPKTSKASKAIAAMLRERAAEAAAARAAANEQAILISSAADYLKENYMDDSDPTGAVWGALRSPLIKQYKIGYKSFSPSGPELPLFDVYDFPGPIYHNELPSTCSALSTEPGNNGSSWPLTTLRRRPSQRRDFASIEAFKQQLDILTCNAFKHVDFKKHNCILAGGVVETCLRAPEQGTTAAAAAAAVNDKEDPRGGGDADVFFTAVESWNDLVKNAVPVGAAIVRGMLETPGIETVRLERRTGTLNIFALNAQGKKVGRPVQLVLLGNTPPTTSRVLQHFDLDSCQFGWQGGNEVLATWKGLRAWVFQANVIDIEHIMASRRGGQLHYGSLSCELRIFKYWLRGYAVSVPGLTQEELNAAVAEATASSDGRKLNGLPSLLYLMRKYTSVGGGYDVDPFMLDGVGADAAKIQEEAKNNGWDCYRSKPLNPKASIDEAVFQLVDPYPSGDAPWHETEVEPWSTTHSALTLQKSWISGKEDGITAGVRPPAGYFDDQEY